MDKLFDVYEDFLHDCRARGLSQNTVNFYEVGLANMVKYFKNAEKIIYIEDITKQNLRKYIRYLEGERTENYEEVEIRKLTAGGINARLRAIRAFFNWCVAEEIIEVGDNPWKNIKMVKGQQKIIRAFTPEQIRAQLAQFDRGTFSGLRSTCIIMMFIDTGIRLAELCNLTNENVNMRDNTIFVEAGKGKKDRIVPFSIRLKKELKKYIVQKELKFRDKDISSRFFVNENGEGLSRVQVQKTIKRAFDNAGITGIQTSAHSYRHTFAINYLKSPNSNIYVLQAILGHTKLETVKIYLNLTQNDITRNFDIHSPLINMKI